MTLPNFLIIGAAKAGTSSVFYYLKQHPQIFGCPVKEPGFFAFENKVIDFKGPGDEALNSVIVTKYADYLSLFGGVSDELAIGEASAIYLHSEDAPSRIKHYIPDVKIIAILRNPVERAISSFSHLRRDGFESLERFSDALEAEEQRKIDKWQHLWSYAGMGFYYEALKRYYSLFPAENIAIYTYDEFKENPVCMLRKIFAHLGVDKSFSPDTSHKYNVSGKPRSRLLHQFLLQPTLLKSGLKILIPKGLRLKMRMRAMEKNIEPQGVDDSDEVIAYLYGIYREDILKTQELVHMDLTSWLK